MQKITNASELKTAILQLESRQANEWMLVKDQMRTTAESLKLSNILKSTFKAAISTPDLKSTFLNTVIGLSTGLFTKKLLIGKTINPIKKLLGMAVELVVANKVVNNADGIKSIGSRLFKMLGNKRVGPEKG